MKKITVGAIAALLFLLGGTQAAFAQGQPCTACESHARKRVIRPPAQGVVVPSKQLEELTNAINNLAASNSRPVNVNIKNVESPPQQPQPQPESIPRSYFEGEFARLNMKLDANGAQARANGIVINEVNERSKSNLRWTKWGTVFSGVAAVASVWDLAKDYSDGPSQPAKAPDVTQNVTVNGNATATNQNNNSSSSNSKSNSSSASSNTNNNSNANQNQNTDNNQNSANNNNVLPPPPPPHNQGGNDGGHGGDHGKVHGNNGIGNGQDPQPPGNPPVNDGSGTGQGNPGNRGHGHNK